MWVPMRAKQIVLLLGLYLLTTTVLASDAMDFLLRPAIPLEDLIRFNAVELTNERLVSGSEEFAFLTRDYGFGRELREVYVYRRQGDYWNLTLFARTLCDKPTA